jgi:hypothetical protein
MRSGYAPGAAQLGQLIACRPFARCINVVFVAIPLLLRGTAATGLVDITASSVTVSYAV